MCVFLTTVWAVSTIFLLGVRRPIIPGIQIATGPPMYWVRFDSLYQGKIEINSLDFAVNASEWIIVGPIDPILTARRFGFVLPRLRVLQVTGVPDSLTVIVPMWLPLVVFAIPTAILWRRDRRPRKGHCPHCGYNLTGNESGKCPECATPVPKQETTA